MDIKIIFAGFVFLVISSCGYYCPQTQGGPSEILDIQLANRRDTISLGDTLSFQSLKALLPFTYQNLITWDEGAFIDYQLSCGRLDLPSPDTLYGFMQFITSSTPVVNNYYGPRIRSYRQAMGYEDFFQVHFLPLDTGNYWISMFVTNVSFSDSQVPDYKGACNRNVEFWVNFKNLKNQPLMEHFNYPYQYIQCIANDCDTLVYTYGFRVEP